VLTNESGHSRQVNWTNQQPDTGIESVNSYQQELGAVSCTVEPKKRVYLMVRALNPNLQGTVDSVTKNFTPSYDIMIRQCQEIVSCMPKLN
jgi:hypothetical protein